MRRHFRPSWSAPDSRRSTLPQDQHAAVSLAASAWGFTATPEALVTGSADAPPPSLDRAAAPPIDAPPALPGEARARRRARKRR